MKLRAQDNRQLDEQLQRAADHRPPRQQHGQARQRRVRAEHDQRANHPDVPHDAARVRQQEPMVAVEDAETPGGYHEDAGAGEEDPHNRDRQRALFAAEPWCDQVDEQRRRQHADQHERRHHQDEQRGDGARHTIGLAPVAARQQRGIDRNERCRQRTLAEEVLQHVRNAQRGVEGVGRIVAEAEIMREDPLANQAGDAAEENAGGDENGAAATRAARVRRAERVRRVRTTRFLEAGWPVRPA
jgi:hypothetical protein